jgi:hypothetical protein
VNASGNAELRHREAIQAREKQTGSLRVRSR